MYVVMYVRMYVIYAHTYVRTYTFIHSTNYVVIGSVSGSQPTRSPGTNLAIHNWRKAVNLICQNQVLQTTWGKEEGLPFLQRHCTGELWFIVIVTEMGDLVENAGREQEMEGKLNSIPPAMHRENIFVQCEMRTLADTYIHISDSARTSLGT